MLVKFEQDREKNRLIVEESGESSKKVNTSLLEFDKHSQTPNDSYAIRIRLGILLNYLAQHFDVEYSDEILEVDE
jgi:predicted metal-binding protein